MRWTVDFAGFGLHPPLQGPDGRLFLVNDGVVFGQPSRHIVSEDGRVLWSGGDGWLQGLVLATNGDLVVVDRAADLGGEHDGVPLVRRFAPSGREIWRVPIPEGVPSTRNAELAAPGNGDILLRSTTHLIAVSATGTVRWRAPLPEGIGGSPGPIVDRDGNAYVASGGRVLSFTADGRLRWEVTIPAGGLPVPPGDSAIPGPGRLIIGAEGLLLVMMESSVMGLR